MTPWKTHSSKDVYKSKWLRVTEDEIETEAGYKTTWIVVHNLPFAVIIPWDGERFTLVGLYRHPIGRFSWEFPAGLYEHESIEQTAREELEEETGWVAGKLEKLGGFAVSPGFSTQMCHVFLAKDLTEGERKLEGSEQGMRLKQVTLDEFRQMMHNGDIFNAPTISAFQLLVNADMIRL